MRQTGPHRCGSNLTFGPIRRSTACSRAQKSSPLRLAAREGCSHEADLPACRLAGRVAAVPAVAGRARLGRLRADPGARLWQLPFRLRPADVRPGASPLVAGAHARTLGQRALAYPRPGRRPIPGRQVWRRAQARQARGHPRPARPLLPRVGLGRRDRPGRSRLGPRTRVGRLAVAPHPSSRHGLGPLLQCARGPARRPALRRPVRGIHA
ncbi:Uncharacterised protein [Bordetella pertussis]|nr:Uncharacterised protein [Bordetella pertussis]